jgi:ParB family chromosome partitioning protein
MATPQKKVLGRGLEALLAQPSEAAARAVHATDPGAKEVVGGMLAVPVDSIDKNPFQPRTYFDPAGLQELADSIAVLGIVQPLTVRKLPSGRFQLISGERRWRASQMAGLTTVPVYIRLADDQQMLEMALVENIQRRDLDAIEVAMSYRRLMDECQLTQEQCAQRVGKSRAVVAQYVGLLSLSPLVQAGLRERMIDFGHARPLSSLPDLDLQESMYQQCVAQGWSVRKVEEAVRLYREQKSQAPESSSPPVAMASNPFQRLADHWSAQLGTPVVLKPGKKGQGTLVVQYSSEGDLLRLADQLGLKIDA